MREHHVDSALYMTVLGKRTSLFSSTRFLLSIRAFIQTDHFCQWFTEP